MSMEEFIREIEKNPSPAGAMGGGGNELIEYKKYRKEKDPKTGKENTIEFVDVRAKTRLTSPTSFTVFQATVNFIEQVFGEKRTRLLRQFDEDFQVNMISKDGLSRDEHVRLKQMNREAEENQKSLLKKLSEL